MSSKPTAVFGGCILLLFCMGLVLTTAAMMCGGCVTFVSREADRLSEARTRERNEKKAAEAKRLAGLTEEERLLEQMSGAQALYLFKTRERGRVFPLDLKLLETDDIGRIEQPMRLLQVLGPADALVRIQGETYWLTKVDTSEMADGRTYQASGVWIALGTKRYAALLGGTRQVWQLEAIDTSLPDTLLNKEFAASVQQDHDAAVERYKAERLSAMHEFNSRGGQHSLKALFVKLEDGQVHLEKEDGTIIQVEASKLAGDDLKWIREHVIEREKELDLKSAPGKSVADAAGLKPGTKP